MKNIKHTCTYHAMEIETYENGNVHFRKTIWDSILPWIKLTQQILPLLQKKMLKILCCGTFIKCNPTKISAMMKRIIYSLHQAPRNLLFQPLNSVHKSIYIKFQFSNRLKSLNNHPILLKHNSHASDSSTPDDKIKKEIRNVRIRKL